jgi:hypothetical protein
MNIKIGDYVAWKWANGVAEGKVIEISHERTEIESRGSRIVRNGSEENPAIIIKHLNSGNEALKLSSELTKI